MVWWAILIPPPLQSLFIGICQWFRFCKTFFDCNQASSSYSDPGSLISACQFLTQFKQFQVWEKGDFRRGRFMDKDKLVSPLWSKLHYNCNLILHTCIVMVCKHMLCTDLLINTLHFVDWFIKKCCWLFNEKVLRNFTVFIYLAVH